MYYSDISHNALSKEEVFIEILQLCGNWYYRRHPKGNFIKYILRHTDLLNIDSWPCFHKIIEKSAFVAK